MIKLLQKKEKILAQKLFITELELNLIIAA